MIDTPTDRVIHLDPTILTLSSAAKKIQQGELTSKELTSAYLSRIGKLNAEINAYITITEEHAMRSASTADAELASGKRRSALHGIPIALKDMFETKGIRTTAGSKLLIDYVPKEDGFVVQQLANSGAVLIGKLNQHEWGLGVTSINPHFGPVANPWDAERIPGGSSGGSAAAVASRLCLGSLGTDTGGSIRIPSSFCGTVGLKPTYGCVSLRGVIPLSWSLDHAGPITRTVEDAAIMFEVISGYDELDSASPLHPAFELGQLTADVDGLRVLVPTNYFFEQPDDSVSKVVLDAVKRLESLGALITYACYGDVQEDLKCQGIILLSEAAAYHRDHIRDHAMHIGGDVLARLRTGQSMSMIDLAVAQRKRVESHRSRAKLFEAYDVMVTPSTPTVAPLRADLDPVAAARRLTSLTAVFNYAGLPAISVPCGFTCDGLPVGMQLVAGPWQERLLLRAAYTYQSATEWHKRAASIA